MRFNPISWKCIFKPICINNKPNFWLGSCFDYLSFRDKKKLNEKFNNLIDNQVKIDKNICSKSCCKFTQWPVPFNTENPNVSKKVLDQFIGTNFTCNNGPDGGGCVCATKNDLNYLTNHGQDNKD